MVEGILLDDYYLHKIIIKHNGKTLRINKNSLIYKKKTFSWIENDLIYFRNMKVIFSKMNVKIEIFHKNYHLNIFIKKSMNIYNIEHLDVYFNQDDMNRKLWRKRRYEGLIGDIQRKNIYIIDNIQSNKNIFIYVDGRLINGIIQKRLNSECILLSVQDLIQPKKLVDYVRFK